MKSWLRIATALACGICVEAAAADNGARAFTATDLNMLARISDPQVSPDGDHVVYVQRETDLDSNRGRTDLWVLDLTSAKPKPRRLTQHSSNDTHPRWEVDGTSIYFLSSRTGSTAGVATAADRRRGRADHRLPARREHLPVLAAAAGVSRSAWRFSGIAPTSSARASGSTPRARRRKRDAPSTGCSCATGIPGTAARARTCSWRP